MIRKADLAIDHRGRLTRDRDRDLTTIRNLLVETVPGATDAGAVPPETTRGSSPT